MSNILSLLPTQLQTAQSIQFTQLPETIQQPETIQSQITNQKEIILPQPIKPQIQLSNNEIIDIIFYDLPNIEEIYKKYENKINPKCKDSYIKISKLYLDYFKIFKDDITKNINNLQNIINNNNIITFELLKKELFKNVIDDDYIKKNIKDINKDDLILCSNDINKLMITIEKLEDTFNINDTDDKLINLYFYKLNKNILNLYNRINEFKINDTCKDVFNNYINNNDKNNNEYINELIRNKKFNLFKCDEEKINIYNLKNDELKICNDTNNNIKQENNKCIEDLKKSNEDLKKCNSNFNYWSIIYLILWIISMITYFSSGNGIGEFLGALIFPYIYLPYKLINRNNI